jgi:lysozyme
MSVRRNTRDRRTSAHGRAFIRREEGCVLRPYADSAGWATVGVGHLITPAHKGVTGSDRHRFRVFGPRDADTLLASDLRRFETAVNRAVRVPLSQAEFDALVSFAFNVGEGGFRSSSVLRDLNAHRRGRVPADLMRWAHPPELEGRRRREGALFRRGRWT